MGKAEQKEIIHGTMKQVGWPGRDIDSFFIRDLVFFIRDFFACVKTAGSLTLNRAGLAGLRAGNMAAAMVNMLSYLW